MPWVHQHKQQQQHQCHHRHYHHHHHPLVIPNNKQQEPISTATASKTTATLVVTNNNSNNNSNNNNNAVASQQQHQQQQQQQQSEILRRALQDLDARMQGTVYFSPNENESDDADNTDAKRLEFIEAARVWRVGSSSSSLQEQQSEYDNSRSTLVLLANET
jgi:hypothetical protein